MRILMIEDSERLRRSVGLGLRRVGYAVDATGSGSEGLWLAESNPYDVIILDLMIPGIDGLTLLKTLRASSKPGANTHVLILTAKDTIEDKVIGLRSGADDYLIKPFSFDELLARIEVLIRRRHELKNPSIKIGNLEINTAARTVHRNGAPIDLSSRQYALLHFLCVRQGTLVTRADIEANLYDEATEPMSNVVDAAVYALRKKIDAAGEPSIIQTRRGMGYIVQTSPANPPCEESKVR